ncbi:MAG: isopropylmalate/homocitrate/citramalate synthase [Rhodobacter sp.]|nr:isopropylmalate/homocitrate/citramalate synthase [Rhodobacter sp.]
MPRATTLALIRRYYDAFNAGNAADMQECLTDAVEHRVNEGRPRFGKTMFAEFCSHMGVSYREELRDMEIFSSDDGTRAAAEFVVQGQYLKTDPGLPEANGQRYTLPAGAFFDVKDGKIARISTFYNLQDWIAQVLA